jgi:hypothetical protein
MIDGKVVALVGRADVLKSVSREAEASIWRVGHMINDKAEVLQSCASNTYHCVDTAMV